ncbi:MAG: Bax inhibitor-1/YccA family protein [Clostridia bacterium]|nr:Bax inhibitor-1/YccA family protein [Clostridia bacterium]
MEEFNSDVIYEVKNQNHFIIKTFYRMFLGLLATAFAAFYTYKSGIYMQIPYGVLAIVELAVVLIFSFLFKKLSPTVVTILFFAYAFINGATFGVIFAIYDMSTISLAFFATSILFGGLAFYGYKTNKDITKFGTILLVALIVGLIVSIINLFIGSELIDIALDWAIILIFCGYTAYDMNKIKRLQMEVDSDEEKLYVYGAMELYLDFINLFLRILRILGRRRS